MDLLLLVLAPCHRWCVQGEQITGGLGFTLGEVVAELPTKLFTDAVPNFKIGDACGLIRHLVAR